MGGGDAWGVSTQALQGAGKGEASGGWRGVFGHEKEFLDPEGLTEQRSGSQSLHVGTFEGNSAPERPRLLLCLPASWVPTPFTQDAAPLLDA